MVLGLHQQHLKSCSTKKRSWVTATQTRREYVPIGSTAASMPQTVCLCSHPAALYFLNYWFTLTASFVFALWIAEVELLHQIGWVTRNTRTYPIDY